MDSILYFIAGIAIVGATLLVIVAMAAAPPYLRDARIFTYFAGAVFFLGTFIPRHSGSMNGYYSLIIVSYSIFFVVDTIDSLRFRRLRKTLVGQRLCAGCGYVLTDDIPCPECNGRHWFVMPKSVFGKWNSESNMPRLWVSGWELVLMSGSTVGLLMLGAAAGRVLPERLTSWQAGGIEFGWVLPMGIWAGAVALAFVVAGAIRRRADRRRRIGSG